MCRKKHGSKRPKYKTHKQFCSISLFILHFSMTEQLVFKDPNQDTTHSEPLVCDH